VHTLRVSLQGPRDCRDEGETRQGHAGIHGNLETGTISPDLPDLLVQEEDGIFHSVKETAQERISALSQLISEVLGTLPQGVPAAKLRLAIELINDLPRLINREKETGQTPKLT
jgi:hypothetical protein